MGNKLSPHEVQILSKWSIFKAVLGKYYFCRVKISGFNYNYGICKDDPSEKPVQNVAFIYHQARTMKDTENIPTEAKNAQVEPVPDDLTFTFLKYFFVETLVGTRLAIKRLN